MWRTIWRFVCSSVCLSVGPSVRKVYCGKIVEQIRKPFGMVSGVGRGMGVLDGGHDCQGGMGSFGGEFGTSHCNQRDFVTRLFQNYFGQDLLLVHRCLSIEYSVSTLGTGFLPRPSICRSVSLFVGKVYCGKMAEWIRVPFGVVSGISRGTCRE